MMREFQAENDQRQQRQEEEERPTDETISALVSVATAPAPVEEPTTAAKVDTPPSLPKRPVPSRVPKSSETVKTTPRRSFNPISDSAVNIPLRLKQATTVSDDRHSTAQLSVVLDGRSQSFESDTSKFLFVEVSLE